MSKLSILKFHPKAPMVRAAAGRDLFFQIIQKMSFSSFLAFFRFFRPRSERAWALVRFFVYFPSEIFESEKYHFEAGKPGDKIISQRSILTIFVTSYLKTVKNFW